MLGIFLSLTVLWSSPLKEKGDIWWARDKAMHLSLSFIVSSFLISPTLHEPMTRRKAVLFTLTLGIAKELFDLSVKKGDFSFKDLTFDFFGTILGACFP